MRSIVRRPSERIKRKQSMCSAAVGGVHCTLHSPLATRDASKKGLDIHKQNCYILFIEYLKIV